MDEDRDISVSVAVITRYSAGAIFLHWVIAFLLAFELALGFAMPKTSSGFALFQLHKSVGIAILLFSLVRLFWRLVHPLPESSIGARDNILAKAVHWGFYAFLIFAPLSGWALVSTAPIDVPTILFGIVPLPHLPLDSGSHTTFEQAHVILAWGGILLFALHVLGALWHEWILRDRLLNRMAPGAKRGVAVALAFGVGIVGALSYLGISLAQPGFTLAPAVDGKPASPLIAEKGGDHPFTEGDQAQAGASDPDAVETASPAVDASATEAALELEHQPTPSWAIQPGGRLGFSVANGQDASIEGRFGQWRGTIDFDPDRPETADIHIEIDLASASVGDATQDGMLSGSPYFDTGRFPKAVFSATSAKKIGNGRYSAVGTLDLKGKKHRQAITFTLSGQGTRRQVEGRATITRLDFGIGTDASADNVAHQVAVTFSFTADRRTPRR